MSTWKSAKSAHAVARSRSLCDRQRQARNIIRRAGQFGHKMWKSVGQQDHWAVILAWVFTVGAGVDLALAMIIGKHISAFFAVASICFGLDYLRRAGWWK